MHFTGVVKRYFRHYFRKSNGSRKIIRLSSEKRKSLLFLLKWILIAVVSGAVGSFVVHSFAFLHQLISNSLTVLSVPLPIWSIGGAVLVGSIIYKIQPGAAGEGIPSYLKGLRYHRGKLNFSETFFKYWAALGTLATFGNGGIVGPLGRVSAGIMSAIGKKFHRIGFSEYDIRTASICGLAATVGSIFHSSVGGGIFAVEIIQKAEMRYRDLFPAVMASATAVYISKAFGWTTFYPINAVNRFMDLSILGWLLLTAVATGVLGSGFNSLYRFIVKTIKRENIRRILLKVVIGTVIAAWIGWFVNPHILGTSKGLFDGMFTRDVSLLYGRIPETVPLFWVLLLLIAIKAFGNTVTVGSGMSAGFTGPAVIIGMLLGTAFAALVGVEMGTANYFAFIAAGFSGMLASSMNIPLAAAVITIESFGLQYGFPAGVAAVIGFQVNRHNTIYDLAINRKSNL